MNNKNTKNKSKGVGIYDFTKKLDYELKTTEQRIELLNNIMYTKEGNLVEFFENLFDQDERESVVNSKHCKEDRRKFVNLLPTCSQPLSEDIYECKQLEKYADYILNSPDQPKDKQQEYTFYNERDFERLIRREDLYSTNISRMNQGCSEEEEIDEGTGISIMGSPANFEGKKKFSSKRIIRARYISEDSKMAYLERIGENYYTDSKQRITASDLLDPELAYVRECQLQIDKIRGKIRSGKHNNKRWIYTSIIKSLTDAQIQYKDCKKGTIYLKDVMNGSTVIDYDEFDFFDKSQVLALLNLPERQISPEDDLSLVLYDMSLLMDNIDIRDEDLEVVNKYRNGISQEEIVKELVISQQNINQVLSKLADNVIREYENIYEDWYYLNKVKGKYKKCSKCGEIKLQSKFSKHVQKQDGLRPNCKQCDIC